MPQTLLRYSLLFLALVLAQVLICNHIILFGVAVPFVYIYFLLHLPIDLSTKWVLTLSFLTGFIIDIFSDTPGVATLSCTILGALRKPVFKLYTGGDEAIAHVVPSARSLSLAVFAKYAFTLTIIYCCLCFLLEYFTFLYIGRMVAKIIGSTLLTFILILGIDALTGKRKA